MRRSAPLLVAFATLLAGGAANDPAGSAGLPGLPDGASLVGSIADPALRAAAAAVDGAARYSGGVGAEPTLAATADGIFLVEVFLVKRSADDGATWTDITPRYPTGQPFPLNDNDPFLFADPATGRVFVDRNQAAACTILSFTDDAGASWTHSPEACSVLGVNDHQTLVAATPRATTPLGYPSVLLYCANGGTHAHCARSLDGGLAWAPIAAPFPPSTDPEGIVDDTCSGITSHLAAAPDGTVYLPAACDGLARVAVTQDDGLTWSVRTISETVGSWNHEIRVAVDDDGVAYAVWQGEDGFPYLARSEDAGATWSAPRNIAFPGLTGMDFPAIVAGEGGRVAAAYVGTTAPDPYGRDVEGALTPQLAEPAVIPDLTWFPYLAILPDARLDDGPILTTVLGDPADPIARGECGRTRCDGLTDFIGATLDARGRVWVALTDACIDACATPDGRENTFRGVGGAVAPAFAGTLARGPALRGPWDLPPLPPGPDRVTAEGRGLGLPFLPVR